MSQQSCSACNDLREYAPEFVVNGTTDEVGEHLKNDEGLSGANNHTDCEDLLDVNDCLIGNMIDELDGYEVCDWKDFMAAFIGNMYETIKAMVYSTCGQWCAINSMYNGASFSIGEDTSGDAYAVAGKGVSFLLAGSGMHAANLSLMYVAGGLLRGGGSFYFYNSNFTDAAACGNFDQGSDYRVSQSRLGNPVWGSTSGDGTFPASAGELICEFRIKKSAYPQVKQFITGFGRESDNGSFGVRAIVFSTGRYAYGQHGSCNSTTGAPDSAGYSSGHLVPDGWWYIQLRMSSCNYFPMSEGHQYSPYYFMGIRMNADEIRC